MPAMEAKDIKLYALKFLGLSVKTVSLYVQKYPLASGVLLLFFLLYLFFPFVFKLLAYSVPILACITTGIRIYLSSGPAIRKAEGFKGDGKPEPGMQPSKSNSDPGATPICRLKKPVISPQMSKRRNFKTRREDLNDQGPAEVRQAELYVPDDNTIVTGQRSEKIEEIGIPILGQTLYYQSDHGVRNEENMDEQAPLVGESDLPKPVISLRDETPDDLGNREPSTSQAEAELEEAEDDDEEDQAQDAGNQVVEWTEDDEKNVMDLGFSELERNRRLENLIAKRRARKFMIALRGQPNLLDLDSNIANSSQLPPVQLTKSAPFDVHPSGSEKDIDSQLPGSAPSILLPAQNPFDIPYDPHEEKPILTTDEFQQEILAASQPRDIFCRHESFTLGPSFSANIYQDQDLVDPSLHSWRDGQIPREARFSRFRILADKGDHDRFVEQILYQRHNFLDRDEHEDESPKEMPKPHEIMQEENTENSDDSVEKNPELASGNKDTEPRGYSQNEVLAEPKEEAADSDSSSTSEEKEESSIQKETGKNTLDVEKVDIFPEEPDIPREGSPIDSDSNTTNGPFYSSGQAIVEYLDRGMGHNTSYSIASDMQVEVSETSSPRNIPDDIMTPPDIVLEEDESKELKELDHHQQEDATDLGISGLNMDLVDSSLPAFSVRDIDEEDSARKILTSSSSTNPNTDEGHSKDQVVSNDNICRDKASGIRKPGSPDSLDTEIPEAIEFVFHLMSSEVRPREREDISSSTGSSRVEIRNNLNEIIQESIDDKNNGGPIEQDPVDEIRNHARQEIISHAGKLEEEDIHPFASPTEEASMTYSAVDSVAQKAEDGEIKSETAEEHKREFQTRAGEERNLSSDMHNY